MINTPKHAPLHQLLLTGAAGHLGRVLRQPLGALCHGEPFAGLRLSDRESLGERLEAHEAFYRCDLADQDAVRLMLQGVDAVVHLGGIAAEAPFAPILDANVRGIHHLYEAARLAGTRRVVLASSNHVTGCYEQGQRLDPRTHAPRPDGFYGVSKLFGENMAQLYWDRCGIETVCLRLGSVAAEPEDRRALYTWLSHPDFVRLVLASLKAPAVGCLTVYGVSRNTLRWWTESGWQSLGYEPQDSSEPWRAAVYHRTPAIGSPMARLQGGSFLSLGEFSRADALGRAQVFGLKEAAND